MIEIGKLPNGRAAQALVDHLKGMHIECKLTQEDKMVTLFVISPNDASKAHAEFENFVKDPNNPRYLQASWDHGNTRPKLDYGSPVGQLLSQFVSGAGPLTLLVCVICGLIYLGMIAGFAAPILDNLSYVGATPDATSAQFWRFFTPSLLHFSTLHLVFNLLWWWYLGGKIEKKLGMAPLFLLLLIGGTLPNLVQDYFVGPNFGGLSGVVYALFGYSWVMGRLRPEAGILVSPSLMIFMLLWLLVGFTSLFGLSIANGAHIGGLLIGLIQGYLHSRQPKLTQ